MKKLLLIPFTLLLLNAGLCPAAPVTDIPADRVHAALADANAPHPRLFVTDAQFSALKQRIDSDPRLQDLYAALRRQAEADLQTRPVERVLTGRRLLGVSRECLGRVLLWSLCRRLDGDPRWLERAEREMLAAAEFTDWNPSHFLDVAEMTAALAIGYDWLYDDLSDSARETIGRAILEKGLQPSLDRDQGLFRGTHNWSQVCNGGITLGALAVMEDHPDLAEKIVHRAVNGIQVVMNKYEPDGAYPEGPGYWEYGTTYNVLLLAGLESVLGTDFGLSEMSGFSKSADYYLHVCGPTGLFFNYPDSGSRKPFTPAVFWFARRYDRPELAWNEYRLWQNALPDNPRRLTNNRTAPLALLWAAGESVKPGKNAWMGLGETPVVLFRTAWEPDAVYLAVKGGSPGVNHGHMDAGSFVLDADGVRWAVDLGPENYHKIESLGMDLWNMRPDSDRWTIFRYNNRSHNTLVVNGKPQHIHAYAPIVRYADDPGFAHAVIDLSPVYEGQLKTALRGAAMLSTGQVLIQDEWTAADEPATVRWAMATPANISIDAARRATLTQKGKTLGFEVLGHDGIALTTFSAEPKADYDEPNPGITLLGFEVDLQPGQHLRLAVVMTPGGGKIAENMTLKPILDWSEPLKK